MTTDGGLAVFYLDDFLCIGHLVETQLLGYLRTYLGGITVDGLTTSDNDIYIAYLLDGCSQCIRGSQGIGAGKQTVGKQPSGIGATIEALTDYLAGTGRTHGEHTYGAAGILLFQTQSLLKGVQVFGVEDSGQRGTVYSAFCGHRVFAHISCVWYLLCKYNNVQTHKKYI